MTTVVPCAAAAAAGVASHVLYFNRSEHHFYGTVYLNTFLLSCAAGIAGLVKVSGYSVSDAITSTSAIASCYLVGLYTSLLVYRAFLHPLNKFPGPWMVRLGNLFMTTQLTNSDAYYKLQALHKKHGDFVRIGTDGLSIIDPDAMELAYGPHSKVMKSNWYDGDAPLTSMHTSRDKALHDRRRKVWAPAFSDKALRDYEQRISDFNDKFLDRIREFRGGAMDVTKWFNLYSFDAMGRLAFGKDYGMLDSGDKHEALVLLSEGMEPLALWLPIWFFRMMAQIPGLAAGYHKFVKFCKDELSWRVQNQKSKLQEEEKGSGSDIMTWLLKAYKDVEYPERDPMLQADSRLVIVAGSDTTAATLTYLFFHLAQSPNHVRKIRDELKPLTEGDWTDKDIKHAQHLNGAINEALRLHPPVPSGVSRLTPKEGMQVGETFVPGNTIFIMPQYVMGRGKLLTL